MRDHLVFYVNGVRQAVRGRDAFLSLSDFLRRRLGLVGTKIVCSEGDCGACTVLIGRAGRGRDSLATGDFHSPSGTPVAKESRPLSQGFDYKPVDCCIQFLFQLDGVHVVTVEGLRPDHELNAIQRAMIDCHGSQCGFCTPGFVMSMTGLREEHDGLDEERLRSGLTGNLCRCTGYTPIIESGLAACSGAEHERLNDLYPPQPMLEEFADLRDTPVMLEAAWLGETHVAACPTTLAEALEFLAQHPAATIVAGASDIGVRLNKTQKLPPVMLDLNRVAELDYVHLENGQLRAGARATWSAVLDALNPSRSKGGPRGRTGVGSHSTNGNSQAQTSPAVEVGRGRDSFATGEPFGNGNLPVAKESRPLSRRPSPSGAPQGTEVEAADHRHLLSEFIDILSVFGAPQIRHVGTLAGNIANASPIADSLPLLFIMEATLVLASAGGRREVNINDFYLGYKKLDLRPGELIAEIRVPLPAPGELLRLYKVSRRRDLDIAGFTAGIRLQLDDDSERIAAASIAFGAVGPTVLRTRETESFLKGKRLSLETMQAAGDVAVNEVAPITDVRGSADYRRQLVRNVLLKFYYQTQAGLAVS